MEMDLQPAMYPALPEPGYGQQTNPPEQPQLTESTTTAVNDPQEAETIERMKKLGAIAVVYGLIVTVLGILVLWPAVWVALRGILSANLAMEYASTGNFKSAKYELVWSYTQSTIALVVSLAILITVIVVFAVLF